MADSPARDLFRDPDFIEAFEAMTRHIVAEIVENANPHPSGTDAHQGLRDLITRIARDEIARQSTNAPGAGLFTGLKGDLDRSGAPIEPEVAAPLAGRTDPIP